MIDKYLDKSTVINLVYTGQATRMADEYARLKAEVELWKLRSDNWQKFCQLTRPEMTDELNRLKAEVERFKFTLEEERQIAREDWAGLRADYARLRSVAEDNKRECEATRIENARLKAERDALYAELERIYRVEPLLREAIASAVLASKEVHP